MKRGSAGFTLIEVVVALAVLGVAVFALLESHYASLSLFTDAEEQAIADLAVNQAVAHAEEAILSGKQEGSGELGARFPEYSFTFSAKQPDQTETPGLYEVTVTVTGPDLERTVNYLVYNGEQVNAGS